MLSAKVDNSLRNLHNSSHYTKAKLINSFFVYLTKAYFSSVFSILDDCT